jgi:hypothetical protein
MDAQFESSRNRLARRWMRDPISVITPPAKESTEILVNLGE